MTLKIRRVTTISKKIYLCGGMGAFGRERFEECNNWREHIKSEFIDYSIEKVRCCNPNDHFNFLDDTAYKTQREIMEFDLHKVRNSDVIIVNFNDPKSIGSACEMAIAYELKIPIVGLCENGEEKELHPWLKEFCVRIFDNIEELILYVIKHYINE